MTDDGPPEGEPNIVKRTFIEGMDMVYNAMGAPAANTAESFLNGPGTLDQKVDSLISWHVRGAAAVGFTCSVGGLTTSAVTIPANLASSLALQFNMIRAIALMYGFKASDARVKMLVFAALLGDAALETMRTAGIQVTSKMGMKALAKVPGRVLIDFNKMVGFRFITKAGETGAINLVKWVPLLGGVVGGVVDGFGTKKAGQAAKKIFSQLRASMDEEGFGMGGGDCCEDEETQDTADTDEIWEEE